MTNKQRFQQIVKDKITRNGIDELMNWLEQTDFFLAPASTVHHQAYVGGLCEHSLQVYDFLCEEVRSTVWHVSDETVAVVALFHDLIKINTYTKDTRNVKNPATGQWEKVPYWKYTDNWGLGHSEGSVFLIQRFIGLSTEEAAVIGSHMGFSDARFKGGSSCINTAFSKYPLSVLLHIADLKSTYLFQKTLDNSSTVML